MARPACSGRKPGSTTMLFRVTIRRPGGRLRRRARSHTCSRRVRRLGKRVHFTGSGRALPPFFLFMERHRRRLRRSCPNISMVQMAKRLGRMWQKLPEGDKELYKDMAERMKNRRACRRMRSRSRSRSRCQRMSGQRKNLLITFTTKAASLRNFLMSYL